MQFAPKSPNAVPKALHRMGMGAPMDDCPLCGGAGYWRDGFGTTPCPCAEAWKVPEVYETVSAKIGKPKPECISCRGRGGHYINGKWVKCECMRVSAAERKLMREFNRPNGSQPWRQQKLF